MFLLFLLLALAFEGVCADRTDDCTDQGCDAASCLTVLRILALLQKQKAWGEKVWCGNLLSQKATRTTSNQSRSQSSLAIWSILSSRSLEIRARRSLLTSLITTIILIFPTTTILLILMLPILISTITSRVLMVIVWWTRRVALLIWCWRTSVREGDYIVCGVRS